MQTTRLVRLASRVCEYAARGDGQTQEERTRSPNGENQDGFRFSAACPDGLMAREARTQPTRRKLPAGPAAAEPVGTARRKLPGGGFSLSARPSAASPARADLRSPNGADAATATSGDARADRPSRERRPSPARARAEATGIHRRAVARVIFGALCCDAAQFVMRCVCVCARARVYMGCVHVCAHACVCALARAFALARASVPCAPGHACSPVCMRAHARAYVVSYACLPAEALVPIFHKEAKSARAPSCLSHFPALPRLPSALSVCDTLCVADGRRLG